MSNNFLNGIAQARHHFQVRDSPWATFFYGVEPPKSQRPLPSVAAKNTPSRSF